MKSSTTLSGIRAGSRERLTDSLLRASAAGFTTDAAADVATEDSAAVLTFAFAATAAACSLSRFLAQLHSLQHSSVVGQRQCTRNPAGFTQRKDHHPLIFQQVYLYHIASRSVSAMRPEVDRRRARIPISLLVLVAVVVIKLDSRIMILQRSIYGQL